MQQTNSLHRLGWCGLLALIGWLFLPRNFVQGMFFDGMVYATLARNLALDIGSFWTPIYHGPTSPFDPGTPFFAEHPPLFFGLEAGLFRLMGTGFFVEKIACLLFLALTIGLISWLWRLSLRPLTAEGQGFGWWAVLGWYLCPVVIWAYPNNLLEIGMTVFDLLAIGLLLTAWQAKSAWRQGAWALLAGLATGLAFLAKGPVGLFPLAFPLIWSLVWQKNWWRGLVLTAAMSLALLALALGVSQHAPARTFFDLYLHEQVGRALSGTRESTVATDPLGRFALLPMLATELAPMGLLLLLLGVGTKLRAAQPRHRQPVDRLALAWLLLALAASLPIMLSSKQRHFYLLPSLPFYALAFASVSQRWWQAWSLRLSPRGYRRGLLILGAIGLGSLGFTLYEFGRPGRDADKLAAIEAFAPHLEPGQRLYTCATAMADMGTAAYFDRYLRVYLEAAPAGQPVRLVDEKYCEPVADSLLLRRTPRFGLRLPGHEKSRYPER